MILETIIILGVLFFIAVLFYKQANEQFEILQISSDRLQEIPTLYADRSPIVVSGFQTPALGTASELQKRGDSILLRQAAPGVSLETFLQNPSRHSFTLPTAEFLAKETGLSVWFEHHLFQEVLPNPFTKFFYSFKSSLWPHHRGLFKTTAFQTILMPTQGTARVCLMLPKMMPYLPTRWQGKQFQSLSQKDTPLLSQIQFLEVVLRKGNLLFLPPHLLVDIDSQGGEPAWTFVAEVHHPISKLS